MPFEELVSPPPLPPPPPRIGLVPLICAISAFLASSMDNHRELHQPAARYPFKGDSSAILHAAAKATHRAFSYLKAFQLRVSPANGLRSGLKDTPSAEAARH